jgi:hypothetical protein
MTIFKISPRTLCTYFLFIYIYLYIHIRVCIKNRVVDRISCRKIRGIFTWSITCSNIYFQIRFNVRLNMPVGSEGGGGGSAVGAATGYGLDDRGGSEIEPSCGHSSVSLCAASKPSSYLTQPSIHSVSWVARPECEAASRHVVKSTWMYASTPPIRPRVMVCPASRPLGHSCL